MQLLRTLKTTEAGDSDDCLLDNWPKGKTARAIDLDLDMPVTLAGAAYTPTVTDLINAVSYFLGVFSFQYGAHHQHKPFEGVTGGLLRLLQIAMLQREVWNDFVGVAQGAPGAHVWHARIRLTPNRHQAAGLRRLIGWTQGRSIKIDTREAGAMVAGGGGMTRTAAINFVCRVIPVFANDVGQGGDHFSHLPYYRETNKADLDVELPDGKPLLVWDANAAADATAITKFSLKIGDQELHKLLEPNYVTREYRELLDAGAADITAHLTPFYAADPFADEKDLPTGRPYVKMVTQDVASIMARAFYFPPVDDAAATQATAEAAEARNEVVTATVVDPPTNPRQNGHAATASFEFIGQGDSRAALAAGLRADADGNVEVFVPKTTQDLAAGVGTPALAAKVEKVTALAVPGTHGTDGRGLGNVARTKLRQTFAKFRG